MRNFIRCLSSRIIKKGLASILSILLAVFCCNGCVLGAGLSDWTYSICDGYSIWHINKDSVVLHSDYVKFSIDNVLTDTPVSSNIRAFVLGGDYLLVESENSEGLSNESAAYTLIDTESDEIINTYDNRIDAESEFSDLSGLSDAGWIYIKDIAESEKKYQN